MHHPRCFSLGHCENYFEEEEYITVLRAMNGPCFSKKSGYRRMSNFGG
jgi:hypothetical protein